MPLPENWNGWARFSASYKADVEKVKALWKFPDRRGRYKKIRRRLKKRRTTKKKPRKRWVN